jgi:hypothetical protein
MRSYFQITSIILLIFGISACFLMRSTTQENTSQPTFVEAYHPLTTRTGIEEVDRILVASGDVQMLRSLIQFTNAKCTRLDGLGGPPKCRGGEADGTSIDVLPFLGPEGSFLRRDEIEKWPGFEVSGLFAIYEVSAEAYSEEYYPAGQYAILFVGKENQPAISLRVHNSGIVRVDYVFDDSLESLEAILQREAAKLIVAPVSRQR